MFNNPYSSLFIKLHIVLRIVNAFLHYLVFVGGIAKCDFNLIFNLYSLNIFSSLRAQNFLSIFDFIFIIFLFLI